MVAIKLLHALSEFSQILYHCCLRHPRRDVGHVWSLVPLYAAAVFSWNVSDAQCYLLWVVIPQIGVRRITSENVDILKDEECLGFESLSYFILST